ncbi:hypothetical protein FRC10_010419, partial [Ceratobasidium sp. 414]
PGTDVTGNLHETPTGTEGSENVALTSNSADNDSQPSLVTGSNAGGDRQEGPELDQSNNPAQLHEVERGAAQPSATSTIQVQIQSGIDPADPSQEAAILEEIGNLHTRQYQQRGQLQDINVAIACHSQAASLTPDGDPRKFARLGNVGSGHLLRFHRLGKLGDLETAIACHSQAASMIPDGHPQKFGMLANLGGSYLSRFEHLGQLEDLEAAIQCQSRAMWLMPEEHSFRPGLMNNLGQSLYSRYERLGHLSDLNKAIENQDRSISLTPDDNSNKPGRLNNLGRSHLARFERLGQVSDLNMSIEYQMDAISLTPDGHPEKPGRIQDLSAAYYTRFKQGGEVLDLQSALEGYSAAVALTPNEHPDKPKLLNNLATSYFARYENSGEVQDLKAAISNQCEALSLVPDEHPSRPAVLNSLGNSLSTRFGYSGNLADLDKAIGHHLQAVHLTSDNHPDKPKRLSNLGLSYRDRFQRLGDRIDLEEAIACQTKALSLVPDQHTLRYALLVNSGAAYYTRFEVTDSLADINSAVDSFREALSLIPAAHSKKHMLLNDLGVSYYTRFHRLGELSDLEAAIDLQTQGVLLLDDAHPNKPGWLNNLGLSYYAQHEYSRKPIDLDKALDCHTESVSLIPEDHPLRSTLLQNLGRSYRSRFNQFGESGDLDRSLDYFKRAAESFTGPPSTRMDAALHWARLSLEHKLSSARDAYKQLVALIPRVVWLGSPLGYRYSRVESIRKLVLGATTAAIIHEDFDTALEWFEEGRSIVWKQLLQLRTPLDELFNINPTLAKELKQVSHDLESVSNLKPVADDRPMGQSSLEHVAQRHRRLAEQWERLVAQARLLPAMSNFLLPTKASQLVATAQNGAIVSIVVHETGCNALIIAQHSTKVAHVSLPGLTVDKTESARLQLTRSLRRQGRGDRGVTTAPRIDEAFDKILLMLWTDVAKPVLQFLGHMETSTTNELPNITWCTTGALNFLPIHAAGDYSQPGCTLFDYAISSYTPALSNLLVSPPESASFSGIVAVGQESTLGFSALPGTVAELDQILEQARDVRFTRLDGEDATTSTVLAAMDQHEWVHFACHASQNLAEPTKSAFHLHDGALDLAAVTQKPLSHAHLAFLSACQTATGDENLPEEAVHLAAGMILAGYRTVVATMWSIDDADAPVIAEGFYAYMLKGGQPSGKNAARALHAAVGRLRAKVGAKEFGRWVPYIHIGI